MEKTKDLGVTVDIRGVWSNVYNASTYAGVV